VAELLAFEFSATLLGLAAIVSAVTGAVTSIIATRRTGKEAAEEAAEDCRLKLREARAELEVLAEELHTIRMGRLQ
jgi:uncharacterized membrane protein